MFSTALSENVPVSGVGTALTLQTAAGFLTTVVSIQAVSLLAEATSWQWTFLLLLPGPLLGTVSMFRADRSAGAARSAHVDRSARIARTDPGADDPGSAEEG